MFGQAGIHYIHRQINPNMTQYDKDDKGNKIKFSKINPCPN